MVNGLLSETSNALDFLRSVCRSVKIPVYTIGGINADNINSVAQAGADGACIMSGFMTCENPAEYIENLRKGVEVSEF